jgi:hypothetical protein
MQNLCQNNVFLLRLAGCPRYPRFPQAVCAGATRNGRASCNRSRGAAFPETGSVLRRRLPLEAADLRKEESCGRGGRVPEGRSAKQRRKPMPTPLSSGCPAEPELSGEGTAKGNLPGFAGGDPMGPTEAARPPPEPPREKPWPPGRCHPRRAGAGGDTSPRFRFSTSPRRFRRPCGWPLNS